MSAGSLSFDSVDGAGGSSPSLNVGRITITLKPFNQRKPADQVVRELRPKVSNVLGAKVFIQNVPAIRIGGSLTKSPYQYVMRTAGADELYQWAPRIEQKLRTLPGLIDVTSDLQITRPEVTVEIEREKASALGVSAQQIDLVVLAGRQAYAREWMNRVLHDPTYAREYYGVRLDEPRGGVSKRARKLGARLGLVEPARGKLACSNLAHVLAAAGDDKPRLQQAIPNIGVVTSYNDMLSAHQPFEKYPEVIRAAARTVGATAQVAGGVPAMCDGVTQGRAGMELSLFSRDVIALATAVALSHEAFDGAMLLGICDKIVPGLFIGAAAFGQMPIIFTPGGPMPSGIANKAKAEVRQRYAEGLATRDELLAAEMGSYHNAGTCTFYGTANSNQMLMEMMGLHIPGAAFVNPNTPLRHALTVAAAQRVAQTTALGNDYLPFVEVVDERSLVNAIVGLMATGGSTNHVIHLVAMARAVGLDLNSPHPA